jgi:hypothetical protein
MKKIKSGKGLFEQIQNIGPFKPNTSIFDMKWLNKVIREIDGTSARNRRTALNKNRINRWSKETRNKYKSIKEKEWLEQQKKLIIQNQV